MGFVDVFVDARVMLQPVDPVDGEIVPDHEQHRRNEHPRPTVVANLGVQETVAAHLAEEPWQGHDVDEGHGAHGRDDFLANLVLEKTRVVLQPPVEDEIIRQRAENPVQRGGANLGDDEDRDALAHDVVARPGGPVADRCIGQVGGEAAVFQRAGRRPVADGRRPRGHEVGIHAVEDQRVEDLECGVHGVGGELNSIQPSRLIRRSAMFDGVEF